MISVIIPTFNRANVITRSIESVLNQTYSDIEVLIIDDNSQDETEKVVKEINDERVKYVRLERNKGACYARNYGVSIANGEYIAFQDSDDVWYSEKLQSQLQYLEKNKLDVLCSQIRIVNDKGFKIFPEKRIADFRKIYFQNIVSTQTLFGKKECFIDVKFDEELPRFQDWDIAINLLKRNYRLGLKLEPLVDVYFQENSISTNPDKAIRALEIFSEKHGINDKVKAHYIRLSGLYKLQDGQDPRAEFKTALLMNPKSKKAIMDYTLSLLRLRRIHYNIYKKKGRFK